MIIVVNTVTFKIEMVVLNRTKMVCYVLYNSSLNISFLLEILVLNFITDVNFQDWKDMVLQQIKLILVDIRNLYWN